MDRLLEMPEAEVLVQRDVDAYRKALDDYLHRRHTMSYALRNYGKSEEECVPKPQISPETWGQLAFLYLLHQDLENKKRQSLKASKLRRDFSLEDVFSLLDDWADRKLREGSSPELQGWKKHVYMSLGVSAWSVVASRIKKFGLKEEDLFLYLKGRALNGTTYKSLI